MMGTASHSPRPFYWVRPGLQGTKIPGKTVWGGHKGDPSHPFSALCKSGRRRVEDSILPPGKSNIFSDIQGQAWRDILGTPFDSPVSTVSLCSSKVNCGVSSEDLEPPHKKQVGMSCPPRPRSFSEAVQSGWVGVVCWSGNSQLVGLGACLLVNRPHSATFLPLQSRPLHAGTQGSSCSWDEIVYLCLLLATQPPRVLSHSHPGPMG